MDLLSTYRQSMPLKLAPLCTPKMEFCQRRIIRYNKQDRHCTYNVTWSAFVQPLLQWKNNKYYIFWVFVCSLRYPEDNAHATHCHLWPARLYNIFPHFLISDKIRKTFTDRVMRVLFSCTTFVWNISHSNKNWARCDKKCLVVFMWSARYSFYIWTKLEIS
jgi:hypothetical protein